ncbi:MAG: glycosyltransferase family 4 protein [Candidatus Sumerlaeota bacterium]|nr:glycosyltransferase family 4 protein [Candidatus Sumerlaeota bacterium]
MRPLMICRQFLPIANGTERQAFALARELTRLGHPARVVAGRFDPAWPARETIDGVAIVRLPSPRTRFIGTGIFLRALRRYLLEQAANYDAVHVHFAKHSAALAGRLSRRLGRPVLCKAACAGEFGDLAAVRRTLFPNRLLSGIMNVDRLIALSDDVAKEWTKAGFPAKRIARIPNGVDADRFRPASAEERRAARLELGLPTDALILLGVGRLERQKAFGDLIDAVARAPAPDLELHVALAGEGSLAETLRRQAEERGLAGRVHLLGPVERMERAYRAADLYALSSLGEGMSNALLEAMASGLDVVATRVSGVEPLVRDGVNGLLADPGSSDSLAEALGRWLAGERGRFGAEARRTIEEGYTLRKVAERTLALYEEVILGRGA